MQINDSLTAIDGLVSQGQIVQAVEQFFAPNAKTTDFDGTITQNKDQMIEKMTGFVGSIAKVNGIQLHQSFSKDNISLSEYTFDFDMKDGSHVLWHEIIRREWSNGLVVDEQYFKN